MAALTIRQVSLFICMTGQFEFRSESQNAANQTLWIPASAGMPS